MHAVVRIKVRGFMPRPRTFFVVASDAPLREHVVGPIVRVFQGRVIPLAVSVLVADCPTRPDPDVRRGAA